MTVKNCSAVTIIQARMGATRLPAKVLMDVAGERMLARVVSRTLHANGLDAMRIAITIQHTAN